MNSEYPIAHARRNHPQIIESMRTSITPYQRRYEIRHALAVKMEAHQFHSALEEAHSAYRIGSILLEDLGFVETICGRAELRKTPVKRAPRTKMLQRARLLANSAQP